MLRLCDILCSSHSVQCLALHETLQESADILHLQAVGDWVLGNACVCVSGVDAFMADPVADAGRVMSNAIMIIARNLVINVPTKHFMIYGARRIRVA